MREKKKAVKIVSGLLRKKKRIILNNNQNFTVSVYAVTQIRNFLRVYEVLYETKKKSL